jgi:heptosyltransferase-2
MALKKTPTSKNRKTVMISLLGSEELKTYPLNYMTAVIDTLLTITM